MDRNPPEVEPAKPKAAQAAALLATTCFALWACGEDGPARPEPPKIEELDFAPELGVDISQMTRLPSGLYVRDRVEGEGDPVRSQTGIRFSYEGWLHDGTPVDRGIYPASVFLPGAYVSLVDGQHYYLLGSGQTIAAWDLGLDGMRVGGVRQVVAPPVLGYGGVGSPDGRVPPNAVLVYDFELLAVEP